MVIFFFLGDTYLFLGYLTKAYLFGLRCSNSICIGLLILYCVPNNLQFIIFYLGMNHTAPQSIIESTRIGIVLVSYTDIIVVSLRQNSNAITQVPFLLQYLLTWINVVGSSALSFSRPTSHHVYISPSVVTLAILRSTTMSNMSDLVNDERAKEFWSSESQKNKCQRQHW